MTAIPRWQIQVLSLVFFALASIGAARAAEMVATIPDVIALLEAERYAELDGLLTDRLDAYRKAPDYATESALYWLLQRFENADPDFEDKLGAWIVAFPDSYVARLARGNYYQHLGWISRGDRSVSRTAPAEFEALKRYLALAKADYSAAMAIDERMSFAYAKLIQLTRASGGRDQRAAYARIALRHDPLSVRIRVSLLYSLAPKWGGSIEELNQVVEDSRRYTDENPGLKILDGILLTILADEYRIRGLSDEAFAYYDRAARTQDHWIFKYERGLSHYSNSRNASAIRDFDDAIARGANWSTVWRWRAWAKIKSGDLRGGMDDFTEALDRDNFNPAILRGRAKVFVRQKRWKEALDDLESALVYGKYDARIHIQKARIYRTALSDPKQAIAATAEAEKLDPRNPKVWFSYSAVYSEIRDCRVVPSLHRYLSLCENGADCSRQNEKWAQVVTRMLLSSAFCPEVYKVPANYVRAVKSFF